MESTPFQYCLLRADHSYSVPRKNDFEKYIGSKRKEKKKKQAKIFFQDLMSMRLKLRYREILLFNCWFFKIVKDVWGRHGSLCGLHFEKAEVNGWNEEQQGQTTSPLRRQEEHVASAGGFEGTQPNNSACSTAVLQ